MPHDAESIALPCRASNRFYAHQLLPCRGLSQPFRCPTAVVAVSLATRPQPGSDLREVAKRQRAGLCPDCRPTTRNSKWPPALSLETCFGLRASTQQFRGSSHVKPCQHPGTLTIQLERRAEPSYSGCRSPFFLRQIYRLESAHYRLEKDAFRHLAGTFHASSALPIQQIASPKVSYPVLSSLTVRFQNGNNKLSHCFYGASWPRA